LEYWWRCSDTASWRRPMRQRLCQLWVKPLPSHPQQMGGSSVTAPFPPQAGPARSGDRAGRPQRPRRFRKSGTERGSPSCPLILRVARGWLAGGGGLLSRPADVERVAHLGRPHLLSPTQLSQSRGISIRCSYTKLLLGSGGWGVEDVEVAGRLAIGATSAFRRLLHAGMARPEPVPQIGKLENTSDGI